MAKGSESSSDLAKREQRLAYLLLLPTFVILLVIAIVSGSRWALTHEHTRRGNQLIEAYNHLTQGRNQPMGLVLADRGVDLVVLPTIRTKHLDTFCV